MLEVAQLNPYLSKTGVFLLALIVAPLLKAIPSSEWEPVLDVSLAPGSSEIFFIRQKGLDLAVKVASDGRELFQQEGPDQAIGGELIVLANDSIRERSYELSVSPVFNGLPLDFEVIRWPDPSDSEVEFATRLSLSHQSWSQQNSAAETLLLLEQTFQFDELHELRALAVLSYSYALMASGDFKSAIDFISLELFQQNQSCLDESAMFNANAVLAADLEKEDYSQLATIIMPIPGNPQEEAKCPAARNSLFSSKDILVLSWLLAEALEQARHLAAAQSLIENVQGHLQRGDLTLDFGPREIKWFQASVNITHGRILVLTGAMHGDDELKLQGADLVRQSYQAYREDPDNSTRGRLVDFLAGFYSFYLSRTNSTTEELLVLAEELFNKAGDRSHIGAIRNNQAYAELGKGNISRALELYLEALDLLESSKHLEGRAHIRARLGYLYYVLGDYAEATSRYNEAIRIYDQELNLPRKLIHNKLELADVFRAASDYENAIRELDEVFLLLQESNSQSGNSAEDEMRLRTQYALTYLDSGDVTAASQSALLAERNLESRFKAVASNSPESAIRLHFRLEHEILSARIDLAEGNFEDALSIANASLGSLSELTSLVDPDGFQRTSDTTIAAEPLQNLELIHLRMRAYQGLGLVEKLLESGTKALEYTEAIRNEINFENQAPLWESRTSKIRDLVVSTHLSNYLESNDDGALQQAFRLIQGVKARSLRESRHGSSAVRNNEEVRSATRQVILENQELMNAVLAGSSQSALQNLRTQLDRSEEELARLSQALAQGSKSLSYLSVDELKSQLNEDTVALIYTLGEPQSYLITISRNSGVSVLALEGKNEVSKLVRAAVKELNEDYSTGSRFDASSELAEILLPPSLFMDHKNLLVEADGVLNRVPFAVLAHLQNPDSERTVVNTPSFSEYFSDSEKSLAPSGRRQIAMLANPSVKLEPVNGSEATTPSQGPLSDLPFTLREASAITSFFDQDNVINFTSENATIANLLSEEARNSRILHIASHGFASQTDSEFLGLALASDSESGKSGLLTAFEIGNSEFDNELVVIGACDTAVGLSLRGEGVMSLSRSFLANGATATISTLWPVLDRANFEFMGHFYSGLVDQELTPPEALAYAQARLRARSSRYNHPKHWGAYILEQANHIVSPLEP